MVLLLDFHPCLGLYTAFNLASCNASPVSETFTTCGVTNPIVVSSQLQYLLTNNYFD